MQDQQIVHSYVRNVSSNKQEANEAQSADGIAKLMLIALAILLPQISVPVITLVGAAYGLKTVLASNARMVEPEAVIATLEAPIAKRSYNRRLVVNHYQLSKPVKV